MFIRDSESEHIPDNKSCILIVLTDVINYSKLSAISSAVLKRS